MLNLEGAVLRRSGEMAVEDQQFDDVSSELPNRMGAWRVLLPLGVRGSAPGSLNFGHGRGVRFVGIRVRP